MKKENIIKKNWEFQKIIIAKKQIINKYLILYYVENDRNKCEIGISIPKKFTHAVKRNFLKRQIKAILDNNTNVLKLKLKIILIARKEFINLPFETKKYQVDKIIEILIKNLNKK